MIAWLAVSALAFDAPTPVWFEHDAKVWEADTETCTLKEASWTVPGEVAGIARTVHHDGCGWDLVQVEIPGIPAYGKVPAIDVLTTADAVTTKRARKSRWARAEAVESGWVQASWVFGFHAGVIVGDPDATMAHLLPWEPVDVVWRAGRNRRLTWIDDEGKGRKGWARPWAIVRTQDGQIAFMGGDRLWKTDPTLDQGQPERRVLVDRFVAARPKWTTDGPLAALPGAPDLVADPKAHADRAYILWIHAEKMGEPVYDPAWIDPVGHVFDKPCPKKGDSSRCGRYRLDYSAMGAWQPTDNGTLVVTPVGVDTIDGEKVPRLQVLALYPAQDRFAVTDAWDAGPR